MSTTSTYPSSSDPLYVECWSVDADTNDNTYLKWDYIMYGGKHGRKWWAYTSDESNGTQLQFGGGTIIARPLDSATKTKLLEYFNLQEIPVQIGK